MAAAAESLEIREARGADTREILELLRASRLPTDGVPDEPRALFVASDGGAVIGVAGLELHGDDALLRSVAVTPLQRGRRIASTLCDAAERRAAELGARRVFLLTETAEKFFLRRGYSRLERTAAPAAIAASREFASVCPQSAALLFREL